MKLLKLKIIESDTCGGLLNGLVVHFRETHPDTKLFTPLCLIGPNGSGKSQVLQIIAEIFQAVYAKYIPDEELGKPNDNLQFEIEYLINIPVPVMVKIKRVASGRRKPDIIVENMKMIIG